MNICLITILFCTILSSAFAAVVPFEKDDSVVRTGDQVEYLCSVEDVDSEGGLTLLYRASDGQVERDYRESLSGDRVREMVIDGTIRNQSRAVAAQISNDEELRYDGIVEFEDEEMEDMEDKKMPASDESDEEIPGNDDDDDEWEQFFGLDSQDPNDKYFDIEMNAAEFLIRNGHVGQAMLSQKEIKAMDKCPRFVEVQTEILFREFYDYVTREGKFSNSFQSLKKEGIGFKRPMLSRFTFLQIFTQLTRFLYVLMHIVDKWNVYCMTYDPKYNTRTKLKNALLWFHRDSKIGKYKKSRFRLVFTFGRGVSKVTTFKSKKKGIPLLQRGNESHVVNPHGSVLIFDGIGSGKFSNFYHKVTANGPSLSVVIDVWMKEEDKDMTLNEFIDILVRKGVLEYCEIEIVEEDRDEEDSD